MDKALTKTEETALAIPAPTAPLGLEKVKDDEDLIIPRLRVVQPTSKMSDQQGHFHNNITNTTKPEVRCIFLNLGRTRVYWDPEDLEADPLCASNDAEEPRSEYGENHWVPESGKCADCVKSKWHANGDKPACALGYTFLGVDLDAGLPFFLNFARTSAKTAKNIISFFRYQAGHQPLFSCPIVLTTEKVESDKGKWYVIRHAIGDELSEDSQLAAKVWYDTFGGVEIAPDLSQEAPPEDEEIPF